MKIINFDTISSTNTYLKEHYRELDNLTCVTAKHQTNGKGRLGRTWIDDGDLLFSILIKNGLDRITDYSLLIAHTLFKVLNKYNLNISIKWPNDIIASNRKIAGILLEAVTIKNVDCVVIGVGVNTKSKRYPSDLLLKATSMENELKCNVDNNELLTQILKEFEIDYQQYLIGSKDFLITIQNNNYLLNKEVEFIYQNQKLKGVVEGINLDGIIIRSKEKILNITSGEISFHELYNKV